MYAMPMGKNDHLKIHLELCKQMYLRMQAEDNWPWDDSQNLESLVESDGIKKDV